MKLNIYEHLTVSFVARDGVGGFNIAPSAVGGARPERGADHARYAFTSAHIAVYANRVAFVAHARCETTARVMRQSLKSSLKRA